MANRKRSKAIHVRLTDEEYEWLNQLAEETGMSISDWFRQAVRKAIAKKR